MKLFFAMILYLPFCCLIGQNLVKNHSFEEEIDFKKSSNGWMPCLKSDTPDYFSINDENGPNQLLKEYLGYLYPIDGNACVGIFCYRVNPDKKIKNVRELIQAKLSHSLIKDTVYEVSFFLMLDEESNVAINNFNVFFSKEKLQFRKEESISEYTSQIYFSEKMPGEKLKWTQLKAEYKAKGGERYIVLGNLLLDDKMKLEYFSTEKSNWKSKWLLNNNELAAYYFLDNVIVRQKKPEMVSDQRLDKISVVKDDTLREYKIEEINKDSAIILENIFFEFDKSELLPTSYPELEKLFSLLFENSNVKILIEGHTDNLGSFDYNMELSQDRAQAVEDYLVGKGIDSGRIQCKGHGYTMPIVKNNTEKGRRQNRRVTFKIINK